MRKGRTGKPGKCGPFGCRKMRTRKGRRKTLRSAKGRQAATASTIIDTGLAAMEEDRFDLGGIVENIAPDLGDVSGGVNIGGINVGFGNDGVRVELPPGQGSDRGRPKPGGRNPAAGFTPGRRSNLNPRGGLQGSEGFPGNVSGLLTPVNGIIAAGLGLGAFFLVKRKK